MIIAILVTKRKFIGEAGKGAPAIPLSSPLIPTLMHTSPPAPLHKERGGLLSASFLAVARMIRRIWVNITIECKTSFFTLFFKQNNLSRDVACRVSTTSLPNLSK